MSTLRGSLDDRVLREQLARRAAGSIPAGLTEQVLDAVERTPVRLRRASVPFRWRLPRLAFGGAVALVAVLVASLVVVPAAVGPAQRSSAGAYPAERPLTADELGRVMTQTKPPRLTTLVADVSISAAPGTCSGPKQYRVLGAVKTATGAICVAGTKTPPSSGILAFRVLGPNLLGYVAAVQAAGSRLAYSATASWPEAAGSFLVDGWLGGDEVAASCAIAPSAATDPLDPGIDGSCPYLDWLADRVDLPDWSARGPAVPLGGSPAPAPWARQAYAGGVYLFPPGTREGSIATKYDRPATPVHGVYLVEPRHLQGIDGASWIVVAKVDEVAIPAPEPTLAPTTALTTAQLTALLDKQTLSQGTTLVATTTIEPHPDACPMDSRQTVGLIAGVSPEICVMGNGQVPSPTALASGTFAFRFLGGRYLILLGEVTPPTGGSLVFRVTDTWPLQGKTFLAEGWLGATKMPAGICETDASTGASRSNALGSECPYESWLSDGAHPSLTPEPLATERLALRGTSRKVEAGSFRAWQAVPADGPAVHGVFVVRSATGGCRGASPIDSTGCGLWLVEGMLPQAGYASVTPAPTPVPTPTPAHLLTTAELAGLMNGPALPQNATLAAKVELATGATGCAADTRYDSVGVVAGIDPAVCVYAEHGVKPSGILALRVLGPRALGFLGTVEPGPGGFAFNPGGDWPQAMFVVSGWLDTAGTCLLTSLPASHQAPDPLAPAGELCHAAISTVEWHTPYPAPSAPEARAVNAGPYLAKVNRLGAEASIAGQWLVGDGQQCAMDKPTECETWQVIDRLYDGTNAAPAPTPEPPATPIGTPPATPIVSPPATPSPDVPPSPVPTPAAAVTGPGPSALTFAQARNLVATKANAYVTAFFVIHGTLAVSDSCPVVPGNDTGVALVGAGAQTCITSSENGGKAIPTAEGTWALRLLATNTFAYVGRVATGPGSPPALDPSFAGLPAGDISVTPGYLFPGTPGHGICTGGDAPPTCMPLPNGVLSDSADRGFERNTIAIQSDAYATYASAADAEAGKSTLGYFLLRSEGQLPTDGSQWASVLARVQIATLPTP